MQDSNSEFVCGYTTGFHLGRFSACTACFLLVLRFGHIMVSLKAFIKDHFVWNPSRPRRSADAVTCNLSQQEGWATGIIHAYSLVWSLLM